MAWICTTENSIVFALDFQLYLCSVSSCICVDTTRSIIWSELLACRDVGRCPKLRSLVFHKSRRRASCDPVSISIWTNQPLVLQEQCFCASSPKLVQPHCGESIFCTIFTFSISQLQVHRIPRLGFTKAASASSNTSLSSSLRQVLHIMYNVKYKYTITNT